MNAFNYTTSNWVCFDLAFVACRKKPLCWVQMGLDWQLFHCPTLWRSLEPEKTHGFHHSYWLLWLQISPDVPPKMSHNPPMVKAAHVIPGRVRPLAFSPRSNDLFLSEPSAGWMETATDVRLSPEKPPIPTVPPFLAGQAQYWQDTEFQWSRTFDQSTHFWGVFACFMGVCSNLLSETHGQKLQMGLTHVCSFYHSAIVCETVVRSTGRSLAGGSVVWIKIIVQIGPRL